MILVVVVESKMGNVSITGNKWYSKQTYLDSIRMKSGGPIDADMLVSDLAWLNRNPYRTVNAIYKPGEKPGTTDVELLVQDKFPLTVYTGIDNTGLRGLGLDRAFAGFNWGIYGLDSVLSYQFTVSTTPKKFNSHAASYTQPLPWRHILLVYGGYSTVHTHLQSQTFGFHGTSLQVSGRYQIPLRPSQDWIHEFDLGVDFKRTNNTVDFGGFTIVGHLVNLFQYVGAYTFTYNPKNYKIYLDLEVFASPGKTVGDMNNALYNMLRFDSKVDYFYGRGMFIFERKMPWDCAIWWRLLGQGSTANLLPSEQLPLGGYNSVRGYYERQVNVDDGIISNIEFRTCTMSSWLYKKNYDFRALAFVDFGFGQEHITEDFNKEQYYLLGIGPGLRFTSEYLVARLDWGFRLIKTQNDGPPTRLHFSVIGKF